jgi:hypothetical protein
LLSPKRTKLSCAKLSTRATYVASVPVGYFVLFGVLVLSVGRPVASGSLACMSSSMDPSLRRVTRTYTPG